MAATCEMVAASESEVLLLMDLQDEAHALLSDVVARPRESLTHQAPRGGTDARPGGSPSASGGQ